MDLADFALTSNDLKYMEVLMERFPEIAEMDYLDVQNYLDQLSVQTYTDALKAFFRLGFSAEHADIAASMVAGWGDVTEMLEEMEGK